MKKSLSICGLVSLGLLSSLMSFAGPAKPKVTDVWTCPIAMSPVPGDHKDDGKGVVVGKYRVHFCCGGCPEQFAKLSAKEKLAKATAAAKADSKKKEDKKS